jgi:hypothetical protein
MHMLQSLFYLTTVLHISDVTITHLQEHKTNVTTVSANRKSGSTLVTLLRILTPNRDSVDGSRDRVTYQKLVTR